MKKAKPNTKAKHNEVGDSDDQVSFTYHRTPHDLAQIAPDNSSCSY